ncbi:hypothetical protein [Aliivibrio finisterrensis]|uniref:Lipoprotein n=1 Tax=Aliivibrio finisterrensis TaxID=511998 RepID=A0ABY0I621_9GAMM|nr:hypothetical protein [Aliivibrio finisterrensis]RYU64332.1 hypothetical protein ERW53_10365 [Aliivibrio finisterrensis]RYU83944.1 hypothetical protein ERW52_12205 [Aliivibrio finisterrensis]
MKKGLFCLLPLSALLFGCSDEAPEPKLEILTSCGFTSINEDKTSFTYKCINHTSDSPSPIFVNRVLLDEKATCKITSSVGIVFDERTDDISFDCDVDVVEFKPEDAFNKEWSCKGFDRYGGSHANYDSAKKRTTLTFNGDSFSLLLQGKPESTDVWFHSDSTISGSWNYKGKNELIFEPKQITNELVNRTKLTLKDAPIPFLNEDFRLDLEDFSHSMMFGRYKLISPTGYERFWNKFSCEVLK